MTYKNTSSSNQNNNIPAISSKADELKKLSELKSEGVLNEEEFQEAKKKLLAS